jgi:hypothetical protein
MPLDAHARAFAARAVRLEGRRNGDRWVPASAGLRRDDS